MDYSFLGRTGMQVSRICLGAATFGVAPAPQEADRIVGAAERGRSTPPSAFG